MDDYGKKSSSSLLDKLILPIIGGVIAGMILLFMEYRTNFFTNNNSAPANAVAFASPTQNVNLSIKELTFCEPQFFDETSRKCIASQQVFSQGINKIYISWVYVGNYSGEYSRLWYRNVVPLGEFTRSDRIWGSDGQRDYTFVSYRNGFITGEYLIEFRLNFDNRLINSASFTVQ